MESETEVQQESSEEHYFSKGMHLRGCRLGTTRVEKRTEQRCGEGNAVLEVVSVFAGIFLCFLSVI